MNKSGNDNTLQATKLAPPPKNLPIYGKDKPEFVNYLAWSNYAAALEQKRFLFGVRRRDLRRGTLVIGRSGMGKTKLLQTMLRQDLAHGHGALVMDFGEGLAAGALRDIPRERLQDVVYFNPAEEAGRLAMNPLGSVPKEYIQPYAATLLQTYKSLFASTWSPTLEYLLHTILVAVLHHPRGTMRMAYDMLTDYDYCHEVAEDLGNHDVARFFLEEYPTWRDRHEVSAVMPLINILRGLVLHPNLERLIDTPTDHVDLLHILSDKRILIMQLPPHQIGDTNATIISTLYLVHLYLSMQQRGAKTIDRVQDDFPVYIDEHPRLDNGFLLQFIQNAGSRGLPVTLSCRGLTGASTSTTQQILANTDNLFCFRLFADDATVLKNELLPVFDTRDLQSLNKRQLYCRIVIDGELATPFSAEALEVLEAPNTASVHEVRKASSDTFGIPSEGVY